MQLKTLILLGLSICGLTRVSADPHQSPLRARINHNVIKNIIKLRDQEIFNVFKDQVIDSKMENFDTINFSLRPVDGLKQEDFDFDVKISKEYFGAESTQVTCEGEVTKKNGDKVTFTIPISMVKIQYELQKKFNHEFNFEANQFVEKEWKFDFGDASDQKLSSEEQTEIKSKIQKNMNDFKEKFQMGDKDGDLQAVENFPMDTVIPMAGLFYATHFSEIFEVDDKYVTLGYSLGHFKMLTEKQNKMLKAVKHDFYNPTNKNGQDALFQLSIDDNMFNSLTAVFASVDKSFSGREIMKQNPKTRPFLNMLTTSTIGTVLPTFKEEYGEDKNIDIMFSPSHSLFLAGFPNTKMTGIYIDKNGNWKIQVNIVMNLNVETSPRNWESARDIYMTAVFKMKTVVDDSNPLSKKFSWTPKNVEITNLKVLKGEEEMTMEQMMIQSVTNIQLENVKKMFREFPYYMSDMLKMNPKELTCLGFNVADIDATFKKSQVQFSAYYLQTDSMDAVLCKKFMDELRQSPKKIMNQFNMKNKGTNPLLGGFAEAQKLAQGQGSNPFDALKNLKADAKAAEEAPKHEDL